MTESTTTNIKHEPIEANNAISTASPMTTAAYIQVKPEEEIYDSAPVGNTFVIYEFDETVKPACTKMETFNEASTSVVPPIKPIIINTKFRKKRNFIGNSTASTLAKKVAKESLKQIVDDNVAIATTSSIAAPTLKSTPTAELKVKCLCRLTNTHSSISNGMELKTFFEQMFEETRLLSRTKQRDVKLALLEAVSEAEEYVDARRCCEKCCS